MQRIALVVSVLVFVPACAEESGDGGDGVADAEETGASATGEDAGDAEESGDAGDTGDTGSEPPDGLLRWEIRVPDFAPPPMQTYYACYAFNLSVDDAVHVVGFQPRVDDPHVHHYIVEMYDAPQQADPTEQCTQDILGNMVWGWAPGGEDLMLPENIGFRAGESGTVSFVLQVHYDNPLGDSFVDSGGFDVLYTDQMREHDAGVLTIGDIESIYIPGNAVDHEHVSVCSSEETAAGIPSEMNVIGTWLHAHEFASRLWTEVRRGGEMVTELGREDPYDFDEQTFKPADFVLQPGDELTTRCIFSNPSAEPIVGGPETTDEMCMNFLLYWPDNPNLATCGEL